MSKRAGTLTGWPQDFTLTDEMALYAKERGFNPLDEFEEFKEWSDANAARYANWPAAFKYRIRNKVKYREERTYRDAGPNSQSRPIGFTVSKPQPEVIEQARRDNELARQEVLSLTPMQRHLNIQRLKGIIAGLK